MQQTIPILVTRGPNQKEKGALQVRGSLLTHIRQNRHTTAPKVREHRQAQLQTLDHEPQSKRTRRISSSAASRRFPKDFFKENPCMYPTRSSKSKHKCIDQPMLETFSRKQFVIEQLRGKIAEAPDTPTFKEKQSKGLTTIQLAQNTNKQHTGHPLTQKYSTCPESKIKIPLLPLAAQASNTQQPLISNFNVTLGMKDTLASLLDKRKKGEKEKQNCWRMEKKGKMEGFRIKRKVGL